MEKPGTGDWEYAYSTEKQEKKKTRPEASEKTQRVTFSTTPTAAELAVTGTATEYPRDRKQEETGANQERKKVLEVPGTKSSGGRMLEYKKVLQVRTGSPHVYLQQSSKAEIGDSNCGSVSNAEDIELEAIEQPEIGKIAGSSKIEFVSELWRQGYQLADDRILSGKAGPSQIDVLIGANQVWKVLGSKQIVSNTGIRAIESKLGWLLLGQDEKVALSSTTAISFLLNAKLGTPKDLHEDPDPKKEEIDFAR
ncbi:hypothetical protein OUZ56_009551 [Daphnia magna]|uniref:Peptidase aspartic putative domain-containing protein n=1 Tax=Daphnia magna TaxID=35525 RepID=A0ABR0AGA7_9CRUS|nr:hypothetical protein OUZ56_009551 [Daphnia magna]